MPTTNKPNWLEEKRERGEEWRSGTITSNTQMPNRGTSLRESKVGGFFFNRGGGYSLNEAGSLRSHDNPCLLHNFRQLPEAQTSQNPPKRLSSSQKKGAKKPLQPKMHCSTNGATRLLLLLPPARPWDAQLCCVVQASEHAKQHFNWIAYQAFLVRVFFLNYETQGNTGKTANYMLWSELSILINFIVY